MPRFGIRVNLGDHEGFGFLTLRRSKLLQKELEGAYKEEEDKKILNELKIAKENRFGKLADSIIRIPAEYTNSKTALKSPHSLIFWNVAQAKLFRHYGGDDSDSGVPFVTHSDSSGGMCAQACIFMLEMYHIDNLAKINGIADITYQTGTTSDHTNPTNSISLKGLIPQSVYDYVKINFTKHSRHILSVHNLPDRSQNKKNKKPLLHLNDRFPELGKSPDIDEKAIQKIEVEAYARSLIPQIAFVDIGLLYNQQKTKPVPEIPFKLDKRRPHAILIIGTKYCVDQETGFLKEEIVLNDPATGPLRTIDTEFSLVECARFEGPTNDKGVMDSAAYESLTILPEGMTRQLAARQPVNRINPIKHFTIGILEDLQLQTDLELDPDALKKLILVAIQFPDDETSQSHYENILFILATSVLSKLKINIFKTPNQIILKDISTFIGNKLNDFNDNLNERELNPLNWYWLLCLPQKIGNQIQIHLRLYDASDRRRLTRTDQLKALDERTFFINLK